MFFTVRPVEKPAGQNNDVSDYVLSGRPREVYNKSKFHTVISNSGRYHLSCKGCMRDAATLCGICSILQVLTVTAVVNKEN